MVLCSGAVRRFVLATAWSFSIALGAAHGNGPQDAGTTTELQELRRAAEQGDPEAQFKLGAGHADSLGDTEAVTWLRAAASQGHLAAQVNLASRYEGGIGVSKDYGRATSWYRLAAEQDLGDSPAGPDALESVMILQMQAIAQYQLGGLYMKGLGVPQNLMEAARWYRRAADHGVVAAKYGWRDVRRRQRCAARLRPSPHVVQPCRSTRKRRCA